MLVERAYAKINLTLDVLGKRQDGYHSVDMVMQTLDLSDLLWMEEMDQDAVIVDATAPHIPLDHRNLAVAAAELFRERSGIRRGLRLKIEKNIPVAAGLAGGSADAAAVLRGLNRLWQTGYSLDELADMGAEIGSDVPFCVYGGAAVASGRGERIHRFTHSLRAFVVLTRPPVFVSTADVYEATLPEQYASAPASPRMVKALQEGDLERVRQAYTNGLMATTFRLYPEVRALADRIRTVTGQPVYMSGSGPTLYLLLPTQSQAQRTYNALRGFIRDVHLCRFTPV
ncbi:4-diphosphocytidyl-2-C-methyl-D-erythritol kinase [Alicyclobacillus contaminans]|uniref:4-(cytidine 5'-diphospho)-2-C-methyl-D-erythritol kinase n=1 Tax=Alicyclobacillus contaminans TaxID=392016 RepID=UPI0003F67025|nr:4-(cytidine 5'-diphospho)-2-C-methyl-D-erythritol kinase [Alicyclobacillus contaminans]GMA50539.1 4-diphosphocytidyl-2-C-methyl-D-erythritol kinase [Alicyclobacillus contaminans]